MFGTDFVRKLIRLTIIGGLLIGLCDPASAYDPKAKQVSLNTSNFDNNLDGTVNDVQELADAVDELSTSSAETDPVVAAISGIVKSNGTTISAAAAGTDYVAPAALSSYVPYSGASGNVNIGTNTYIGHAVRGDASDGLLLEANNGTDVGLLGAGNTANVSWYGSHIFSTMSEGSVAFFGPNGLLSQDNTKFYYNDSTDTLYTYSTLTERVTNGTFTGSATGWTLNSGWAYSSNSVSHSSNGTGVLTQTMSSIVQGKFYKLTFTISGWTVGSVTPTCGGNTLTARSANGTYTEYFLNTNATQSITFTPTNTARFTIDNVSVVELSGGAVNTGTVNTQGLNVATSASNSSPGTTRHITLSNIGSYTYIDAYFGSTLSGAIGWTNSTMNLYTGSSGFNFYKTPTSPSLIGYIADGAMVSYGMVGGSSGVTAGSTSTSQPATLTSWGSLGAKHAYITTNTTLTASYTYVDANADLGSSCSGTPTYSCGHWTNSTDCALRDSHGGCTWNAITCSDYNYTSSGTCEGYSGCTWESTSCSGAYDQSSCESQDDSYGGNCSWDVSYGDCSTYNGNESSCTMTSGCTWDSADCSAFNGDQSTCESTSGCSWSDPNCSGTYYPGTCSGTYESGYTCNGSYSTGNCTGSGGTCTGTSSCAGIDDSTNCGNEAGCSWTTGLSLTLPTEGGYSTNFMRTYFIRNIGASANLTVYPNTDQTVNGTTSLTIAAGKARHLSFSWFQVACSTWDNTGESTCESGHSGCNWTSCSGLDETACGEAGGQCSWSEGSCVGGGNCSGIWNVRRDWTVYGGVF